MAQQQALATTENIKELLAQLDSRAARMRDAHTPPVDDTDLAEWIWAYCGLKVPTVAVCPGHCAPLTPLADAFFERQLDQVWLASRGSGKTSNLSLLYHLCLLFKENYEVAGVGAIREQAQRCYEFFRGFTELDWFHDDRGYSSMKKTVYEKGGSAEILTGTTAGVNCLAPMTMIQTVEGPQCIASLVGKKDLRVWSWNGQHVVSDTVLRVWKVGYDSTYRIWMDGSTFCATADHPVRMIDGSWKSVIELASSDMVLSLSRDGQVFGRAVEKVTPSGKRWVYDMTTEEHHNFFCAGVNVCNSPHPHLLAVDEVELLDWAILQQALSMPMSRGGYQAVNIFTSTRKYRTGTMQRLMDKIETDPASSYKLYVWCLWEAVSRCTLESCEHCKRKVLRDMGDRIESFYEICQGKAKRSDGFIVLEDLWRKFTTMDPDVFDAEWRGTRPGRVGRALKGFSEDIHVRRFPIDLGMFKDVAVVMDDGWSRPLAVLFIGRDSRDNLFAFDCIYRAEMPHEDARDAIKEKFDLYGFSEDGRDEQGNEVKVYSRKKVLYIDIRAPRTIHKFGTPEYGFKTQPIGTGIEVGLRWIRGLLRNTRRQLGAMEIYIHPDTCNPLIDEMIGLHYPVDRDGKLTSDQYKGEDHLLDCLRYSGVVFQLIQGETVPIRRTITVAPREIAVPTRSTWKRTVEIARRSPSRGWRETRLRTGYRRAQR